MKRKAQFCCDASRDMYEDYYANQSGAAMPAFVGDRYQRGHGLGSMLSERTNSTRGRTFPEKNSGALGGNVLKTGVHVVDELVRGKTFKEKVKKRMLEAINRLRKTQTGRLDQESRNVNVVDIDTTINTRVSV